MESEKEGEKERKFKRERERERKIMEKKEERERRTEKGRRDNCARGTFELARSCDQISYGAAAQIKILEKKKLEGVEWRMVEQKRSNNNNF